MNSSTEQKPPQPAAEPRPASAPTKKFYQADAFWEKISLLIITALVSGLLVPYIMDMKAKREIRLQAQAKLLDNISETLMTYETLALNVSLYRAYPPPVDSQNSEGNALYEATSADAVSRYLKDVVDIFIQLRVQVNRANSLASPHVGQKLYDFHKNILKNQDDSISNLLANDKATLQQWKDMHAYNRKILARTTLLIADVAADFSISNNRPVVDSANAQ